MKRRIDVTPVGQTYSGLKVDECTRMESEQTCLACHRCPVDEDKGK